LPRSFILYLSRTDLLDELYTQTNSLIDEGWEEGEMGEWRGALERERRKEVRKGVGYVNCH